MMINGQAHGPQRGTAACQLHMRKFNDGDVITVEPWRAAAFPVVKDLVVNRSAFDRIVEAGGFITVTPGAAQDANIIPGAEAGGRRRVRRGRVHRLRRVRGRLPERRRPAVHLGQGVPPQPAAAGPGRALLRVEAMVDTMEEYFGSCTNHGECEAACPKEISIDYIALMNRDYIKAKFKNRKLASLTQHPLTHGMGSGEAAAGRSRRPPDRVRRSCLRGKIRTSKEPVLPR